PRRSGLPPSHPARSRRAATSPPRRRSRLHLRLTRRRKEDSAVAQAWSSLPPCCPSSPPDPKASLAVPSSSWPGLSRPSRLIGHCALPIESAGTSPAMTPTFHSSEYHHPPRTTP